MPTHIIATDGGPKTVPTEHHAGVFAVHNHAHERVFHEPADPDLERRMRRWVVTHMPSGLKVGWNLTHAQAVSLADHLCHTLGADWLVDAVFKEPVSEASQAEARAVMRTWALPDL